MKTSILLLGFVFALTMQVKAQLITTVAGNGSFGSTGDGGPATAATFNHTNDVAVDALGNLYIVDEYGYRVRKVTANTGIINTIAGTGVSGFSGDGGSALSAQIGGVQGIALDASGNIYISTNNRIRKITVSTGIITTVAGNGVTGYNGDGIPAITSKLNLPVGIGVNASGDIYFVDSNNHRIRKVNASTGIITTIAGDGTSGSYSGYGSGGPATLAKLYAPQDLCLDASGNVYFGGGYGQHVCKVTISTGIITNIAGTASTYGFSGDGGLATAATYAFPFGVAVNAVGNVATTDYMNDRVRTITSSTGIINTTVGNGLSTYTGDGGLPTAASIYRPRGIAFDNAGNLYIADQLHHCIRKVSYCATNLFSSFTAPSAVCAGTPISLNGSMSYGTDGSIVFPNAINNYVWTVVECDAAGTPLAGATEWWSPWGTGNPGAYTIPSAANGGPTMTCGKSYKIKLALQNACVVWAESSKIITINCPPSFKLKGSTSKICTGDIALLNATMNAGSNSTYTLNWTPISPAGPSIYNGPLASVTVSPTVPTTYLATVTDNVTGCSSTLQWFVNVVNNDPTFSLNINTIPATYFTMALSANDPYGYYNSGFYYSLIIEELDGSGNPYYQDGGTDCWWNYPYQETFQGYVSTGTGTFSQSPWGSCPAPAGQFLYNHTYRITRGVWNDQCAYRQFAMIITTVKSGGIEVVEDPNAPDYGALSLANAMNHTGEENAISIYPNPSTGLYTIELADYTDASIEVYNVLGKKVKTMQQTAAKTTVDLTGSPKGVYFVNIRSNGELISKKIILE